MYFNTLKKLFRKEWEEDMRKRVREPQLKCSFPFPPYLMAVFYKD